MYLIKLPAKLDFRAPPLTAAAALHKKNLKQARQKQDKAKELLLPFIRAARAEKRHGKGGRLKAASS